MSDYDNNSMNKKTSTINVSTVWLILTIIVLTGLVIISLLDFFKGEPNKGISIWFIFTLIAAVLSCIFSAITSYLSQKSEENKEANMVQKITNVFTEKADEIKNEINVALKRNGLVSGNQNDILRLLMNHSLLIGDITRIRILAYNSKTFLEFFTEHFKDSFFRNKEFKCTELEILIYDQSKGPDDDIIKKWHKFYKDKTIKTLRIKRAAESRRSFFGMVIEFDGQHSGLIGFYKPKNKDNSNEVSGLNNPYGVFSEDSASILGVLTEYFNYYWDNAHVLIEETETPIE